MRIAIVYNRSSRSVINLFGLPNELPEHLLRLVAAWQRQRSTAMPAGFLLEREQPLRQPLHIGNDGLRWFTIGPAHHMPWGLNGQDTVRKPTVARLLGKQGFRCHFRLDRPGD